MIKKYYYYIIAIVAVAGMIALYKFPIPLKTNLGVEGAKKAATKLIEENLVQPGTKFSVSEIVEESGLYKLTVSLQGQDITSYMTKDGKKFFPSVVDVEEISKANSEKSASAQEIPKKDKPEVELFVMSYCPFGTQIEKGILPVVQALGSKIKFDLKFVDYAMHPSQGEVEENLRQYCIQKEEPSKLIGYMNCFLKKGGEDTSKACVKSENINEAKLNSCVKDTDSQFKVSEKVKDKNSWNGGQFPPFDVNKGDNEKYGVKGSPTLVINGVVADSARDSKSLAEVVCSGFSSQPEECKKEFESAAPNPGFGEGTSASGNSAASCGN